MVSMATKVHVAGQVAKSSDCNEDYCLKRMRKSSLYGLKLDGVERPGLKFAEDISEYKQAFKLVHDEYVASKYFEASPDHPYHYSRFSFLPESSIFILKSDNVVVATLTEIFDTPESGIPMDELYKREVNRFRDKDRRVAELSAFVVGSNFRMRNVMIYLCGAMFKYSRSNSINDICIMVNPKHVKFYTKMFFFEQFGPALYYEKVSAVAVPLRVNLDNIDELLKEKYGHGDSSENLHSFFCGGTANQNMFSGLQLPLKKRLTPPNVMEFFCHPRQQALAA